MAVPRARPSATAKVASSQLHIMSIGPACDQRQRDATRVDQKASLAPFFPRSVGSAPRIRLPREPMHGPIDALPAPAMPSISSYSASPAATGREKSQRVAIVESVREPRWHYRIHAAKPSTGSPYATHKRWRKRSVGRESACVPRRVVDDTGVRQSG